MVMSTIFMTGTSHRCTCSTKLSIKESFHGTVRIAFCTGPLGEELEFFQEKG